MGMIMQGSSVSQARDTCGLDGNAANQASNIRKSANRLKVSNAAKKSRLAAASEMLCDKYALAKQRTLMTQSF